VETIQNFANKEQLECWYTGILQSTWSVHTREFGLSLYNVCKRLAKV